MALPDVSKLRELSPDEWRTFGARLHALGYTAQSDAPFVKLAARAMDPLRAPMAKWHARRIREPGAYALRMFMFWDPVTDDEARAALGPDLSLERVLATGLLRRHEGGVASTYTVGAANGTIYVCDDLRFGGDAVMGLGPTTVGLVKASRPRAHIGSALDLGCGAGVIALLFAPSCDRVVATDINPRAIEIARVNAAINDVSNVEFRIGDLFAPLAGETFDLVVSQPPFIAQDNPDRTATFLYGGPRGDEFPMRVLRELPPFLAPGGQAVVGVEWPIAQGDPPLERRIRQAVGDSKDLSVLVVQSTDTDLDLHCMSYTRFEHPALDEAYERATIARREHFERQHIESLRYAYTVVLRSREGAGGWTSTVQCPSFEVFELHRERIDAAIEARALLAKGRPAFFGARLRVNEGAGFAQAQGAETIDVTLPADSFVRSLTVNAVTMALVQAVHEAPSVKAAIEQFAAARGAPPMEVAQDVLPGLQSALLSGLLEIA